MPKPKVHIDQDGDGDVDVSVDVNTPDPDGDSWPDGVRDSIVALIARMEVITPNRISYAGARETLRGLLANNP